MSIFEEKSFIFQLEYGVFFHRRYRTHRSPTKFLAVLAQCEEMLLRLSTSPVKMTCPLPKTPMDAHWIVV